MDRILLLNVDCTPLRVLPVRRAVGLLLAGNAEPMTDEIAAQIHSESDTIDIPAVIRLGYAVRIPFVRKDVQCSRRGVLVRDNHVCQFVIKGQPCNDPADTIDHVYPKSKGGANMEWINLVASCASHNHKKGSRTLEEMGWKLKRQPFAPKSSMRLRGHVGAEYPASWLPYIPA